MFLGKSEYEDVLQANNLPSSRTARGHQAPAAFIIMASGLDKVKYFLTSQKCFLKNLGRVAEWSALRTGNRGYPSSIPAKDKNFFFQRN